MFTGIIETIGIVRNIRVEKSNKHFTFQSSLTSALKVDQSLAHNGVCLTVVAIEGDQYTVTAIDETLKKTNLGQLTVEGLVNLERCTPSGGRFDGHIVQGHVDQTAICTSLKEADGSWVYSFSYDPKEGNLTVEKGSICINGVSLTVFNSSDDSFSVAIIPYTYHNTNFKNLAVGQIVNLEFDIIGKYVSKLMRFPINQVG